MDVTWLDFFVIGMASIRVHRGWSIFMGIVFFDFIWWSRWMDAIEGVEAPVRGWDGVMVQMSIVGEGAEVTGMIGLRGSELCKVGLRFILSFAFVEVTIELFMLRWIRVFIA